MKRKSLQLQLLWPLSSACCVSTNLFRYGGTIVSTGAFFAGIAVGVFVKKWYDKNVNIY